MTHLSHPRLIQMIDEQVTKSTLACLGLIVADWPRVLLSVSSSAATMVSTLV